MTAICSDSLQPGSRSSSPASPSSPSAAEKWLSSRPRWTPPACWSKLERRYDESRESGVVGRKSEDESIVAEPLFGSNEPTGRPNHLSRLTTHDSRLTNFEAENTMPTLYVRQFTRDELVQRIGRLEQVAGVRLIEHGDGMERGVRLLEFRTGSGFSFDVLVDRAMDIGRCEHDGRAF